MWPNKALTPNNDDDDNNNRDTGSDGPSDLGSDVDGINCKANDRSDKTNSMKCMYTNADNLMNKRSELLAIIEASKPDIIAITETLPKQRGERIQAVELEIPDFDCFKNGANGRGVCIYTKKNLKAIQVEDLTTAAQTLKSACGVRSD